MNSKASTLLVSVFALALGAVACATEVEPDPSNAEDVATSEEAMRVSVEGSAGACKVVGGANKGKRGTYDAEGACCGRWGCTECHGGNLGKCQSVP